MTFDELVELAKRRLEAGSASPRTWSDAELDLAGCVLTASQELAIEVMRDPGRRSWLQQTYSVGLDPVTSEGDLVAATGSVTTLAGEIILEGLYYGLVLDFDGNILHPIPIYQDFFKPQSVLFGHYTLKNSGKILTRALGQQVIVPANVQPVNGPLAITANYTPNLVTGWPVRLTSDLVSKLCEVALRKPTPANANPA